jgi:hypothetical protein
MSDTTKYTDLLFYDAAAATGEFYKVNHSGAISLIHANTDWRKTWTHIVFGNFGGPGMANLFFYEASTGTFEFWAVTNGEMSLMTSNTNWGKNWTHIIPGNFSGKDTTDLLFYDATAGKGEFYTVNRGELIFLRAYTDWRHTWTHIVPLPIIVEEVTYYTV